MAGAANKGLKNYKKAINQQAADCFTAFHFKQEFVFVRYLEAAAKRQRYNLP
ncbi:MAG TPA: hypothetical protein VIO43_07940 [Lutibacter sp.]